MRKSIYFDLRNNKMSDQISLLFPDWQPGNERVAVFGAHDDDPMIGAGYAMSAAMQNNAEVYVLLFCRGDCGYSTREEKDKIVSVRKKETCDAYQKMGIPADHIQRFDYHDFSMMNQKGYYLSDNSSKGCFEAIIRYLRNNRITRVLIPNNYREHADHSAVYEAAAFDIVQANDPIVADWGQVGCVKNVLQYSVWADFSPEDMLVHQDSLRANRALLVAPEIEKNISESLAMYHSQKKIIADLVKRRKERAIDNGYMELYIALDLRPKLDYSPYAKKMKYILSQQR